jgi:acyl-[acyl-carrier-protein]-phospholipid O-acyltransferase/long-chain-fatty-acid--[acyl-carrier-protein] ligase
MQSEAKHRYTTEAEYRPRGFWALVVTQFQGAFNDNLYQYFIMFFALGVFASMPGGGGVVTVPFTGTEIKPDVWIPNVATFVLALPFLFFPGFFGSLADRYSKQRVALATKYIEVGIMFAAGYAFWLGNPYLVFFIFFLMAAQSAMFGPTKYGILPEIIPEARLSWANGIMQMTTIISIILGTILGGVVYGYFDTNGLPIWSTAGVLIGFSVLGILSGHFITKAPAANPAQPITLNPWAGMARYGGVIWNDRILFNVVLGYIYFWFAGALMRNALFAFCTNTLGLSSGATTIIIGMTAIGIAIGALSAGFLSRSRIELGLVPISSIGLAFSTLLVAVPAAYYGPYFFEPLAGILDIVGLKGVVSGLVFGIAGAVGFGADPLMAPYLVWLMFLALSMGFWAGVFDVPLAASIQHRAPHGMKGGIIAATNMCTWFGIAGASVFLLVLSAFGMQSHEVFLITALLSLGMGAYIVLRVPHLIVRTVLWVLGNTLYRVRTLFRENMPDTGPALLVCNAMSFIDVLFIIASNDREIRCVVGKDIEKHPWMARVAKMTGMILVDPNGSQQHITDAYREARGVLAKGGVLLVSLEGPFDEDDHPTRLHNDFAGLIHESGAPVVPVYIDRLWGMVYRYENNRFVWPKLAKCPYIIQVSYGANLPAATSRAEANQGICEVGMRARFERPLRHEILHRGFVRCARKNLRKVAIADEGTGALTYFKTLVGSIAFARKLKVILGPEEMVGVLVPPTVGGALTNIALQLLGKVPVNLNYTANNETLESCARQCGITQVLTADKFLKRLTQLKVPGETILLEDIKESVTGKDRIIAMLIGLLAPMWLLERILGTPKKTTEDLATIIFSSGSEGEPKGVMLTHRNVLTNVEQGFEVFPHDEKTALVGFLPFFHSFGFSITLWMVVTNGLKGIYHPNPLEPKVIGKLIEDHQGTLIIGTSTFLQNFVRRCTPEQLATLEFVVAGAEKLAERVREAFKAKFGVEPLEGYGTTECAPAVSVNVPDCISPGFHSRQCKHGTIGRPLPGDCVRTIDPDTRQILPLGESGLLQVKGPNIMRGYLGQPERTAKVLEDGWYDTGDIAQVDADGFIRITDRLARFSKIAGEMVPHTTVEEKLHALLGLTDQSLAVASVPDAQKGERLVVLHILTDAQLEELTAHLDECDLPNLWIPRAKAFYRIEEIPVLATGKMDIKTVKKMAREFDLGD